MGSPDKWDVIVVTGGSGFLGGHVCRKLRQTGWGESIRIPEISEFDLTLEDRVAAMYERFKPDVVIHLAARVGGIGANRRHPGSFFYDNMIMGIMTMEYARRYGVKKFVAIGTVCAYPKFTPVPFNEANLWDGYPEETNAPYGLAKKMLLVQAQAYRQEYDFNAIYLLPVNLYGPGDNFDPESSHVIPALIRKCLEAKERDLPFIEVWGTGNATREFLYVEDAARAIVLAMEKYNRPEPCNIGAGFEISIRDLVLLIRKLTGYRGEIKWNTAKPDGQPRRCLDTGCAARQFGFKAEIEFEEGLRRTIDWYVRNRTG